jgi:putative ABC transport system permease protein
MAVAIAIGSSSFALVRTLTAKWLPEDDAHRIVRLENVDVEDGSPAWKTTLYDLSLWRRGLGGVEELGAYRAWSRNVVFPDGRIDRGLVVEMAASAFRAVRAAPFMGRMLEDADERPDAPPVAVISYAAWRNRFQSDARVIGRSVSLGGTPHTVVGVMREGFEFPYGEQIWTPLTLRPEDYPAGDAPDLQVVARMAPASTVEGVQAELDALGAALAASQPETHATIRARVLPFASRHSPQELWVIWGMQAMTALIVLIIGINVAILVYARTANRIGEIAIRTALGGSRARVVVQLFSEALVLSSLAAAAGLAAGQYALSALHRYLTFFVGDEVPYWYTFRLDAPTVAYVAGLTVVAAVIVGVLPALKATGRRVQATLQRVTSSGSGLLLGRSWTALIVTQVAIAVWVLPFALSNLDGLVTRRGEAVELRTSDFVTATLELERKSLGTTAAESTEDFRARYRDLHAEVVRRVQADPTVAQVVRTNGPPVSASLGVVAVEGPVPPLSFDDGRPVGMFTAEAVLKSTILPRPRNSVAAARVDAVFFDAFGVPILAGRAFGAADVSSEPSTAIVNRRFAEEIFHGTDPLGRRIQVQSLYCLDACDEAPWLEIVGIVPDFPSDYGASAPVATVYQPLGDEELYPFTLNVRGASTSPEAFANRLREIALSVDPMLSFRSIARLDEAIENNGSGLRLLSLILTLLPLSALLLSAAGIAALMAFTVDQRRREIGIRIALGADGRHVLSSVLSRAALQIGAGVFVGLAIVTFRMWDDNWLNVRGAQLLASVVAVVAMVGLGATLGPARRGLRIHPTEALKGE